MGKDRDFCVLIRQRNKRGRKGKFKRSLEIKRDIID